MYQQHSYQMGFLCLYSIPASASSSSFCWFWICKGLFYWVLPSDCCPFLFFFFFYELRFFSFSPSFFHLGLFFGTSFHLGSFHPSFVCFYFIFWFVQSLCILVFVLSIVCGLLFWGEFFAFCYCFIVLWLKEVHVVPSCFLPFLKWLFIFFLFGLSFQFVWIVLPIFGLNVSWAFCSNTEL